MQCSVCGGEQFMVTRGFGIRRVASEPVIHKTPSATRESIPDRARRSSIVSRAPGRRGRATAAYICF
jgi:hypothetical protein